MGTASNTSQVMMMKMIAIHVVN